MQQHKLCVEGLLLVLSGMKERKKGKKRKEKKKKEKKEKKTCAVRHATVKLTDFEGSNNVTPFSIEVNGCTGILKSCQTRGLVNGQQLAHVLAPPAQVSLLLLLLLLLTPC